QSEMRAEDRQTAVAEACAGSHARMNPAPCGPWRRGACRDQSTMGFLPVALSASLRLPRPACCNWFQLASVVSSVRESRVHADCVSALGSASAPSTACSSLARFIDSARRLPVFCGGLPMPLRGSGCNTTPDRSCAGDERLDLRMQLIAGL